jgi:hypothetical protein
VPGAEHEPEIRQDDQREAVQERDPAIAGVRPEEAGADRARDAKADGAADERAEDAGHRHARQAAFEEHHQRRQGKGEPDVGEDTERKRLERGGGVRHSGDENNACKGKPGHL